MLCNYSYLQENFYKRFDGAVSIRVVLILFDNKVEGSRPSEPFFYLFIYFFFFYFIFFFFFAFAKMLDIFVIYMFAEKGMF